MNVRRLALLLSGLALATTSPAEDAKAIHLAAVSAHVQDMATKLGPHVPRRGPSPSVVIVERAAPLAGMTGGKLEISTGILGLLETDAELAMILATEMARALLPESRRGSDSGGGAGTAVGRAATLGAVGGAVAYGVDEALSGSSAIARGAGVGAATAASTTAVGRAWSRRGTKAAARLDDEAAADGMRTLVSAGYDGRAALVAWDRPCRGGGSGATDGGLADCKANAKRKAKAARALESCGAQLPGRVVGADAYRSEVRAHLVAWRVAETTPREQDAGNPPPAPGAWLSYERSGGITGWTASVTVEQDGHVLAHQSRQGAPSIDRTLPPEELAELRRLVATALAGPARQADSSLGSLRDGQSRSVSVRGETATRTLTLSDGYELLPGDGELIRVLENLLR